MFIVIPREAIPMGEDAGGEISGNEADFSVVPPSK